MGMSEQDDIRALIARIEMDACPGFGDLATQCCKSLDALKAMLARDERAARENEGGEAVGRIIDMGDQKFIDMDDETLNGLPVDTKLYTHPPQSQGVPEGYALAPKSLSLIHI